VITSRVNAWFGGRATTIVTKAYSCTVCTAKEGLFQKQSTMIIELKNGSKRGVGKIIYSPSLRSADRLSLHDVICKMLDEDSQQLSTALNRLATFLRGRGVILEFINIA